MLQSSTIFSISEMLSCLNYTHEELQKNNVLPYATTLNSSENAFVSYITINTENSQEENNIIQYQNISNHNSYAYKKVDVRVKPVPGVFPQEAMVHRQFPNDPLDNLPILPRRPPDFIPTEKITEE
jgi:hypothetical protein